MSLNIHETAVEFSSDEVETEKTSEVTPVDMGDDQLSFTAGRSFPDSLSLDGFNDHGVRENRDDDGNLQSVDVVYEAMEPGPPEDRNGVRITEEFLRTVAGKEYDRTEPYMLGHSDKPLDEVGKVQEVWFSEKAGKLMLMNRVFNTGANTHDEVISRLTHNPPTMTDGSVGLGNNYEAVVNSDEEPELIDGRIREFSTVPFPGGYDNGGVGLPSASFAEKVLEMAENSEANQEELDKVYSEWESMVNMDNSQMERWDDHPCADKGATDGENTRDETLMLMGSPKESWSQQNVDIANRVIDFIATELEKDDDDPTDGGEGTCPSPWAIGLLNVGYNPLDEFPTGNPQFDDGAHGDDSPENFDTAVIETVSF